MILQKKKEKILINLYDNMGILVPCLPFSQPELLGNLGLENKTHKNISSL